eukprot:CAMPEP_0114137300 /NCGR_PEP_ID=MMETSP0043_2-20121206/15703_1 /TAXON_ID=464988 /ORGANISM="Hemiselmis andersenii, Strain CCMP644" /LENGTH=204 /DNA_ID=CAMNT_0001231169 /DNA_START=613 /DNA_END=1225 /DNA_ORIENTATION=+
MAECGRAPPWPAASAPIDRDMPLVDCRDLVVDAVRALLFRPSSSTEASGSGPCPPPREGALLLLLVLPPALLPAMLSILFLVSSASRKACALAESAACACSSRSSTSCCPTSLFHSPLTLVCHLPSAFISLLGLAPPITYSSRILALAAAFRAASDAPALDSVPASAARRRTAALLYTQPPLRLGGPSSPGVSSGPACSSSSGA